MSAEPMELAKNWDETKWQKFLPAYAQVKYDGVPLTFIRPLDGGPVQALTRQNEVAQSVPHLLEFAEMLLLTPGASFTAECLVAGLPFKESSGIIRRQTPDEDTAKIVGVAFDYNLMAQPKETYYIRRKQWDVSYSAVAATYVVHNKQPPVFTAPNYATCHTVEDVEHAWCDIQLRLPTDPEGMMLHSLTKPFMPGKRCWGMGRYKPQPTIDLEVVSFEEAQSEEGEPLGMVGRVNVQLRRRFPADTQAFKLDAAGWKRTYNPVVWTRLVGVGPGKLTHAERATYWQQYLQGGLVPDGSNPVLAEIKYMPDASYDALRQPTVQRLRTDKTEGDILEY